MDDFIATQLNNLKSDNVAERQAAALELGKVRKDKKKIINALIESLGDADVGVLRAVTSALQQFGKTGMTAVIQAFQHPNASIRSGAVSTLDTLRDVRAVPFLIPLLKDVDDIVRGGTAHMLGVLQDRSAVEPLIESLQDGCATVRYSAIFSLSIIAGDEAVPGLAAVLGDKDDYVRAYAVYALGEIRGDVVSYILPLLEDESEQVRGWATRALHYQDTLEAIEALVGKLKNDASPGVRTQAAYSLSTLFSNQLTVKALVEALQDEDTEVRQTVVEALEIVGDMTALPALNKTFEEDTGVTRLGYVIKELAAEAIQTIEKRSRSRAKGRQSKKQKAASTEPTG